MTDLRAFLIDRLPAALVPSIFRRMPKLPLLASGKVDRKALPDPADGEPIGPETGGGEPGTPEEKALAGMWARALGVERVGVHDDFWSLGGQSLTAAGLVAAIREHFQVEISVADVFAYPTVAGLARRVRDRAPAGDIPADASTGPAGNHGRLSTAQLRHWFLQLMEPEGAAYNICDALRITGPLDPAILERALNDIVERHSVLRTRYLNDRGTPVARVEPFAAAGLPLTDLRGSGRTIADLIEEDSRRPFDLSGPPLRWRLVRVDDVAHVLVLVAHHIVVDDAGLSAFHRELSTLYGAHAQRRRPALAPLPLQYADYTAWEERRIQRDLEPALEYWRKRLSGAEPALRLDLPRPERRGSRLAQRAFRLDTDAFAQLDERARSHGTTLFAEVLIALARVLAPRAPGGDVVIGVPFANRPHPDLEHLVGCFINPVALRLGLSGDPSPAALRERVRGALADAHRYQHIPFEKVVGALAIEREHNQQPVFQSVLNYVDAPAVPDLIGCVTERLDIAPTTAPKYDLTLYVTREQHALHGRLVCDADLFTEKTVAGLVAALVAELEDR